ncbi:hypothetical protein C8R44DRAFT_933374 [Mycena epipterygia]|nr:hypothetical protein C8R44DRAFT_933374 [Mycena epipterygia]
MVQPAAAMTATACILFDTQSSLLTIEFSACFSGSFSLHGLPFHWKYRNQLNSVNSNRNGEPLTHEYNPPVYPVMDGIEHRWCTVGVRWTRPPCGRAVLYYVENGVGPPPIKRTLEVIFLRDAWEPVHQTNSVSSAETPEALVEVPMGRNAVDICKIFTRARTTDRTRIFRVAIRGAPDFPFGPDRDHWDVPLLAPGLVSAHNQTTDRRFSKGSHSVTAFLPAPTASAWIRYVAAALATHTSVCSRQVLGDVRLRSCTDPIPDLHGANSYGAFSNFPGAKSRVLGTVAADYARSVTHGRGSSTNNSSASFPPLNSVAITRPSCTHGHGDGNEPPSRSNNNNGRGWSCCYSESLNVMYWNIFHDFTLKLTSPEFHELLREYDIMFFAETDMLPGEDEIADATSSRRGGGVALLIRDTFTFTKSPLSSPDILVLDMGTIWLVGAYIPPQSSRWAGWTNVNRSLVFAGLIIRERQVHPDFHGSGYIDELYQATMDAKQTDEGFNYEGKKSGPAGAGIFFSPDSAVNMVLGVPGPERLMVDRGRLFAIHEAIQYVTLLRKTELGWPGTNDGIFKSRKAETCFVHVESKANNESKRAAYALAKSALNFGGPRNDFVPAAVQLIPHSAVTVSNATRSRRKVYTTLEETSPVKPKPWKTGDDVPDKDTGRSHRGRAKVHALQFGLRQELLACKQPKDFGDFVRKRTDPRPKPAKVSVEALSANFDARLNYAQVTPDSFNSEQLAFNARMNKELKHPPPDTSPQQSYTRDITTEEIEAMKRHIKAHRIDTAMRVDGFSYTCHPEDIELNASGAPSGFQSHLNGAQRWSNNNGCETSIPKCLYQVYGPKQPKSPTFHLGGKPIAQVDIACFPGVWFETSTKFMWREQYKVKAQKANTVANVIIGLDRFVGKLPAWDAQSLHGAEYCGGAIIMLAVVAAVTPTPTARATPYMATVIKHCRNHYEIEAGSRGAIHSGAVSILETEVGRLGRRYVEGGRQGVSPGRQISADVTPADPAAADRQTSTPQVGRVCRRAHGAQCIRAIFLETVEIIIPGVVDQFTDALQTFKGLLARQETTPLLGKLAFDVLRIFDASPMLLVSEPTVNS